MTQKEQWTAVDRYLADLFAPADPALDVALQSSAAAGLPAIHVSATQGKLLMLLTRAVGARRVLEVGTLGGYSTIWLARGLPPAGGRVVTLEAEPSHAEVARANVERAGLANVVEVRVGRALDTLPRLAAEGGGPFDLIFLDADKVSYPDYLEWSLRLARPGSLIIADNVVRDGAVVDARSKDASVRGVRRFNEMLRRRPARQRDGGADGGRQGVRRVRDRAGHRVVDEPRRSTSLLGGRGSRRAVEYQQGRYAVVRQPSLAASQFVLSSA